MAPRVSAAITLADVFVRRGAAPVIHGISVNVERARWLGVIGANGSGKTTLLRAIAGRLPIAAGRCRVDGIEMAGDRSARAQAIGFAPPIERLPALLTFRALLELAGEPIADQAQRNDGLWSALNIAGLLDRTAGEASSGTRQRAAIALAFARPASIAILDEPFNWLDPVAAFDTRAALAAKVADGTTLITALHDLTTLCGFCHDGLVLSDGRVTLRLDTPALREGQHDARRFEERMIAELRG